MHKENLNDPATMLLIPTCLKSLKPPNKPAPNVFKALKIISTPKNLKASANWGSFTKRAILFENKFKTAQVLRLNRTTIQTELFMMLLTLGKSFCIYSAMNLVVVFPKAKVEKVAIVYIVVFTIPYSPYKSFPSILAIIMPDNSIKKLPIPFPKTAQKEFLYKELLFTFSMNVFNIIIVKKHQKRIDKDL